MSAGHEKIVSFDDREPPSIKNFGLTIAAVFLIIALWPTVLRFEAPRYWALVICLAFAASAYLAPSLLEPLNKLWFRFGMLLHRVVNPLVLGLLFVVFLSPIAIVLRLIGKKLIPLKADAAATTYWIKRDPPGPPPQSMKNQF